MKSSNLQVKLLTILLAFVFCFSFGWRFVEDFSRGFKEGSREHQIELENGTNRELFFSVELKPSTFFSEDLGIQKGVSVSCEKQTAFFCLDNAPERSSLEKLIKIVLPLIIFILFVIILVYIFLLLGAIGKGDVFSKKNLLRILKIGALFIIIGLLGNLFSYIEYLYLKDLVSLENYRIVFRFEENEILIGIVILILSSVFRIGFKMKEEEKLVI